MKATLHPTIKAASGLLDDLVYRQVGDQVVIQGRARRLPGAPTAGQLASRERFSAAVVYAQIVLEDPLQREAYTALGKQRKRRPDKLLTSDFLTPPAVDRIDLKAYRGRVGDVIGILATDDIEVVSVHVELQTATGEILEQGAAQCLHGVWRYTATTAAPIGAAVKVIATAQDRPGNRATGTAVYLQS
jgi:hypothetical protein